ncbi:MAG: stress response translation initiation inhibitor YciH [Candidatus Diapherotrites archaeon]|nr:stress response translation initiation inhibitor YciH [Candidatus Diapherotrites archaeon]
MNEVCQKCGLPKDLCICGDIAKETQKIKIRVINRRFGKNVTIVSGFDKNTDVKELWKKMKSKLACGGTIRDNEIELQGNHKEKVKQILKNEGFKEELIDA